MRPYRSRGDGPAFRPDGTLRPDAYRDDPETGCRIWLLSMRRDASNRSEGLPQAWNGHRTVQVRHELWRIHKGTSLTIGAGAKCGNARCVAVDHLIDGMTLTTLTLDDQAQIDAMAGRLASAEIARRIGAPFDVVNRYVVRSGVRTRGAWHPAAKRYAGKPLPPQPLSIDDPYWEVFVFACEHTYRETSAQFGMTPQNVQLIVKRVLGAIDEAP